jgi:UDP-N-acetylglucosamine acyltransferase
LATVIHPTAIVEPGAELGVDCEIQAYAVITRHVRLGDRVVVFPHAVIGGDPQFLKFDRTLSTGVIVGAGTVLREGVTLNRSVHEGKATQVGRDCFLMANSHVAHDCAVGNNVVIANNVMLAGHVSVGDFTFIGGGVGIHQFTRVGESVMIGGGGRISRDIAPYLLVAERDEASGLNLLGLKRRGFSRESIRELKLAFRSVYGTTGNIREIASRLLATDEFKTEAARGFLAFFQSGKRSFVRPSSRKGVSMADEEA